MKKLKTIIFYYNFVFTFGLLLIGLLTKNTFSAPQFLAILIPLILYFWGYVIIAVVPKIKNHLGQPFWIFVSLLLIYNLLATSLILILNFIYTRSFIQFIISLLYLPYPFYFFLTIKDWYQKLKPAVKVQPAESPVSLIEDKKNVDQNRRQFLKLVGGTSLSVIFLSLFNPKKAEAAFFGSVPGPGTVSLKDATGAKINPAEKQPTDGYKISQVDDDSYPAYYGYVHSSGAWYIMREDDSGDFRYSKGNSNFSSNWTTRTLLTYDYFDTVF